MEFNLEQKSSSLHKIYPSDIDPNFINNAISLVYICLVAQGNPPSNEIITSNTTTQNVQDYVVQTQDSEDNEKTRPIFGTLDLNTLIETLSLFFIIKKDGNTFRIIRSRSVTNTPVFIRNSASVYEVNPNYLLERGQDITNEVPLENLIIIINTFNYLGNTLIARDTQSDKKYNLIQNARWLIAELSRSMMERLITVAESARKHEEGKLSLKILLEEANKKKLFLDSEILKFLIYRHNPNELDYTEYDKIIKYITTFKYQFNDFLNNISDETKFVLWLFIYKHQADKDDNVQEILNMIVNSITDYEIIKTERNTYVLRRRQVDLSPSAGQAASFASQVRAIARQKKASVNLNNIINNDEEEESLFDESAFQDKEDSQEDTRVFSGDDDDSVVIDSRILVSSVLQASKGHGSFPDPSNPSTIILDNIFGGNHNALNPPENIGAAADVGEAVSGDIQTQIGIGFGALGLRNMYWAISLLTLSFTAVISYWYWSYYNSLETMDEAPSIGPGYGLSAQPPDVFILNEVQRAKILQAIIYCTDKFNELYDNLAVILMQLPQEGWFETFVIGAVTTMTLFGTPSIRGYNFSGFSGLQTYTGAALTLAGTATLYEFIFNPDGSYIDLVKKTGSAVYQGAELAVAGTKFGLGIVGSLGIVVTVLALGGIIYLGYKIRNKSQGIADSRVDVKLINE